MKGRRVRGKARPRQHRCISLMALAAVTLFLASLASCGQLPARPASHVRDTGAPGTSVAGEAPPTASPEPVPSEAPSATPTEPPPTSTAKPTPTTRPATVWPGKEWLTSTPEEQGMDGALLEEMMALVDRQGIEIDSVVVIRHGYLVFEAYRNGYHPYTKHHLQSVTKSFTSTLIGIAIDQGLIPGVDVRMVDLFPDHDMAFRDERKERITLEHLLTMTPGMDWHETDLPYDHPQNNLGGMWTSRDAVQHVLDTPMAREPGTRWSYNSGTSILLGGILEQVTGQSVLGYAHEVLFGPLGITDVSWAMTTGYHYHTDGGLHLRPRDMARLGYLMLRRGEWNGQQIVSPGWVADATRAHATTPWGEGYGYQWWTMPGTGIYKATGHYEQKIYVVPAADMVVVFTADIADEDPHPTDGFVLRYIVPACTDLPRGVMGQLYREHGLRLRLPAGWIVGDVPFPGREDQWDAAGGVQAVFQGYPTEVMSVAWLPADGPEAIEPALAEALAASGPGIELGPPSSFAWNGHDVLARDVTLTESGVVLAGRTSAWFCLEAGRVYVFSWLSSAEFVDSELSAPFSEALDGLACH